MATTRVKFNADRATKRTISSFNKVVSSKKMLKEIGEFLVKRIKAETRKGKPFNKSRSFPALKSSTVTNRSRLQTLNKTQRAYSARRSNLTFTGQLVEGLTFDVKGKGKIDIFTEGKRRPYKTGERRSARKTPISSRNELLVKALDDKGFKLFGANVLNKDKKILKRVTTIVLRVLRRALIKQNQLTT